MGERLNIEIVKNGDVLANCYYHWSGFSECAINLTTKIIQEMDYIKNSSRLMKSEVKNKDILFAIRLLESTGAGVPEREREEVREMLGNIDLPLNKCIGRNEGLIGVTEKAIAETENWQEESVTIDIEKKTIDFRAVEDISEKELFEEYEIPEDEIGKENINFKEIKFEDVFNLKARIELANYKGQQYFYNEFDKQYYYWIG